MFFQAYYIGMEKQEDKDWLSSKQAKKALKVSDCKLAHLRVDGKLEFEKRGNAFFYQIEADSEEKK